MSKRNRSNRRQDLIPFVTVAPDGTRVKTFISPSEANKLPATACHGSADGKQVNSPSIRPLGDSMLISAGEKVIKGQTVSMDNHEYKVFVATAAQQIGAAGMASVQIRA
jgi:hypothetical protein